MSIWSRDSDESGRLRVTLRPLEPWLLLGLVVVPMLVLTVVVGTKACVSNFMDVDRCLDSGGSWNAMGKYCEKEPKGSISR